MTAVTKLKSGSRRVQVRRKGKYVSETFLRPRDAEGWALDIECRIDRGESPTREFRRAAKTFGELIRLHREDFREVGKPLGRSKAASPLFLERRPGKCKIPELDRERLIEFGRARAREGAGPVTLSIDLGYIKTILSHAAAVHGIKLSTEPIDLGRIALGRLGLVGKGNERDRRPTREETNRIIVAFEGNPRQITPGARIVRFAISTAMRQEEIVRIIWEDFGSDHKMLTIRDRKDPRRKSGNHQRIPLLDVSSTTRVRLLRNSAAVRNRVRDAIFLIMLGPLELPSVGNVVS